MKLWTDYESRPASMVACKKHIAAQQITRIIFETSEILRELLDQLKNNFILKYFIEFSKTDPENYELTSHLRGESGLLGYVFLHPQYITI